MAWPDFTYDTLCSFETGISAGWSETDASSVLDVQNASAKYNGTYGMLYDRTGTATAYIAYDTGSNRDSMSMGLWMYFPVYTDWTYNYTIRFIDSAFNERARVYVGRSSGDNSLFLKGYTTTWSSNNGSWTEGNWYWMTVKFVRNDFLYIRIYDTSHNLVGSELTVALGDVQVRTLRIEGNKAASTSVYHDDIVADWTDATYPLLGWESAATLEQEGFRARNDDGNEAAATWLEAQDTNFTRAKNTNTRLRMLLNATGDPASKRFMLQYRKTGETDWKTVM